MNKIVQKTTTPGNLVLDAFAMEFSAAKAFMLILKHRRCMRYEVGPSCVTEAISPLIVLYGRQLLSEESDTDGREDVHRFVEVDVKAAEAITVRKRLDVLAVSEGLLSMQKSPPPILYNPGTYSSDEEFC